MKVYFSHGKESGPRGTKIRYLSGIAEKSNCSVKSIDYTAIADPDARVSHLLDSLKTAKDDTVLVGSSMGGYVSLNAAEKVKVKGVFLLAPALFIPGYTKQTYGASQKNLAIVHGWRDDVIPVDMIVEYSKKARCELHVVDGDHRLMDNLELIGGIFELFLRKLLTER